MSDRTEINRTMGAMEWALLIVLSVLWGGSFFFAEVALVELRPFTVVLCRVGFAALVLIAEVYATGQSLPRRGGLWGAFFVMGALNNLIPFTLIFWGQTHIASGFASILNATTPLFTVVLAHLLTHDEKMTPNRLAGVVLGLAGVAVLIGPEVFRGLGFHLVAQLAVLGAALSYAFAGIFGRRFRGEPPLVVAAGQVTATTVMILPIALFADRLWAVPLPGATTWAAIAGLAVLSTALAYVIFFRILATAGATNLLLVTLLIPVSAILLGTAILGERLAFGHFAGMALIGLGLAAIDGRLLKALRRRRGTTAD
jgi:drug/metabolite transporter (DMT)-like permease